MDDTVLLRFLNSGLVNVGGDDSKLEKLSQAAKDLAAILKKTPSKALSYSLIAFDPDAPEQDPVVVEALAALQNRWTAYRNTFASTPVAVVRAMLLDALMIAAADDDRVGVCFIACARNVLPLMRAADERAIWVDVVNEVERKVDARAEEEWATPAHISAPPLAFDPADIGAIEVKTAKAGRPFLEEHMLAAIGPQYQNPQNGNINSNGNPYWPQNNPQMWAGEFGRRSSKAIADVIDATLGKIEISQPDLLEPLKEIAASITTYVDGTLNAVSAATAGLQRRTHLLWWRDALYSPSARANYRTLPATVAAAQMAYDLFNEVPLFSPASVSSFLDEAVLRLPAVSDAEPKPICNLVAEAQNYETLAPLRATAGSLAGAPEGRGPLLALIGHPTHANARDKTAFHLLTGVPETAQLKPVEWAAWIFRELQAARAASDGSSAKRRAAKKG